MSPHLPCMNCGEEINPEDAKVFSGVLVCPRCFSLAHSLLERSEHELQALMLMMREAIRIALVEGKLALGMADMQGVSKAEVLKEVLRLEGIREARKSHQ